MFAFAIQQLRQLEAVVIALQKTSIDETAFLPAGIEIGFLSFMNVLNFTFLCSFSVLLMKAQCVFLCRKRNL